MKSILTIALLLICLGAYSQKNEIDVVDYSKNALLMMETEEIIGRSHVVFKNILTISDNEAGRIKINAVKSVDSRFAVVSLDAFGGKSDCISDDAKAIFRFRDDTFLTTSNDGDYNCINEFTKYFGGAYGQQKILKQLASKEVQNLRIDLVEGSIELTFSDRESKVFMNSMKYFLEMILKPSADPTTL